MGGIEILEQMETFTQAEKERYNQIATQSNEDDLTFDDLELYARFQVSFALANERLEMERKALEEVKQAKINAANEVRKAAIENMKARADLAKAKLRMIEGDGIGEIEK